MQLRTVVLDDLTIDDERSFRHVSLYADLKEALQRDRYAFRIPVGGASWDRVLFLNLTFWSPRDPADVLADDHIAADVVAHVAWHHLASRALGQGGPSLHVGPRGSGVHVHGSPEAAAGSATPVRLTADGLLLGESIASAFDLYLVGRLLGHAPSAEFLETQVPAMAEAALAAGLPEASFEALLAEVSAEPERAFEDLRSLLFDATTALVRCDSLTRAAELLDGFGARRFAPLVHHYELSTWILHARAHGATLDPDPAARAIDAALREAPVSLDWLEERWLR